MSGEFRRARGTANENIYKQVRGIKWGFNALRYRTIA